MKTAFHSLIISLLLGLTAVNASPVPQGGLCILLPPEVASTLPECEVHPAQKRADSLRRQELDPQTCSSIPQEYLYLVEGCGTTPSPATLVTSSPPEARQLDSAPGSTATGPSKMQGGHGLLGGSILPGILRRDDSIASPAAPSLFLSKRQTQDPYAPLYLKALCDIYPTEGSEAAHQICSDYVHGLKDADTSITELCQVPAVAERKTPWCPSTAPNTQA